MNKYNIILSVFLASMCATAYAANTATLTVKATIHDASCTAVIGSGSGTVDLGTFNSREMMENVPVGATDLPISITECGPDASRVHVTLSGTPSTAGDGFANSGTATGVQVLVYKASGTKWNPADSADEELIALNGISGGTQNNRVALAATGDSVGTGTVETVLTYSFKYD